MPRAYSEKEERVISKAESLLEGNRCIELSKLISREPFLRGNITLAGTLFHAAFIHFAEKLTPEMIITLFKAGVPINSERGCGSIGFKYPIIEKRMSPEAVRELMRQGACYYMDDGYFLWSSKTNETKYNDKTYYDFIVEGIVDRARDLGFFEKPPVKIQREYPDLILAAEKAAQEGKEEIARKKQEELEFAPIRKRLIEEIHLAKHIEKELIKRESSSAMQLYFNLFPNKKLESSPSIGMGEDKVASEDSFSSDEGSLLQSSPELPVVPFLGLRKRR